MKKLFIIMFLFVFALSACSPQDEGNEDDFRVAVVTSAAGQNDTGYNKAIVDQVKSLATSKDFHAQIVEPTNGVANAVETLASDGYSLIFSMEYDFDAIVNGVGGQSALAELYPDTTFVVFNDNPNVDDSGAVKHENVISVLFNVNESSYLSGYLYVLVNENHEELFDSEVYDFVPLSEARVAAFVGGTNSNGIIVYSAGIVQGMNDAAIEYDVTYDFYANYEAGFSDSALGSTLAGTFFDNKANIVYPVAGVVGDGITAKAREVGRLSVQVDANLDEQQPGHVLTSVLKLTDVPAKTIIESALAGELETMDNLQTYGLDSGATDITDLSTISQYIENEELWSEIVDKVAEKKAAIVSGTLKVVNAQDGDPFNESDYSNVILK